MKITMSELRKLVKQEMLKEAAPLDFKGKTAIGKPLSKSKNKDEEERKKHGQIGVGLTLAAIMALVAGASHYNKAELEQAHKNGSKGNMSNVSKNACDQAINQANIKPIIDLAHNNHINFIECSALVETVLNSTGGLEDFNEKTNEQFNITVPWSQAHKNASQAAREINTVITVLGGEEGPTDIGRVHKESTSRDSSTKITLSELKQLVRNELKRSGLV